ncbi:MAG: GAF domain-containing protein [Pleurocapsa minor GSE-CHR-MK-17-07R]|jgi:PAS domain S-box-containing protein|nr:GAF domain-containing protein [Pleurocapsa minor GSE-CHR-MK 17-07R]
MDQQKSLQQQNQALSDALKRSAEELSAVAAVATTISQSLDLNQTLNTALSAVLSVTGAKAGGISMIDEETNEVVLKAQKGWVKDFVHENPMRFPVGRGISGHVILNDTVFINNHLDESQPLAVNSFHDEKFRSIVMVPMHARGRVVGILSIMSTVEDAFDDGHVSVLKNVADAVGVALDNARLYETTQEGQRSLSAVLQSSADGILATDQSGKIRMMNATAEALLEAKAETLIGLPLRQAPLEERVREAVLFALDQPIAARAKSFRVSSGSGRVISGVVSPIYVESQVRSTQQTDGWVIVLQDMTYMAELEVARSQFIKAAAHDMRNPLTAALNALSLLRRLIQHQSDETIEEVMQIAAMGITRIQSLIDDIASLEQIQSSYEIDVEEVDIGELLYEATSWARSRMSLRQQVLVVEAQQRVPPILIDRRWVLRALHNYFDNACKHTPEGGQITLRVFPRDQRLHIEVVDAGPGIPLEAQARLFERFYRAQPESGLSGVGLGLAMVKAIAEAHGGGVYVESSPGRGSLFGMTLALPAN